MPINEQLITTFYRSFQSKDFTTMQACYADNATFCDPVFTNLNAAQVRSMWEMFCTKGKDLQIEFSNVQANEMNGSAEWKASYTFSATGKKVVNHIAANFLFENGKILQHTDTFDFYMWAKQALGISGLLFGWTSLIQNKVREKAMKNLTDFMNQKEYEQIEKEINQLADKIKVPTELLPGYGIPFYLDFYRYIEIKQQDYHIVDIERGSESSRRSTSDLNELIYWIFEDITWSMADRWESKNRRENEDFRRQVFTKQIELMFIINEDFGKRLGRQIDKYVACHPYNDIMGM